MSLYPLNYYASVDLENFDALEYIKQKYPQHDVSELLKYPEFRRQMTKNDPLLFAIVYLSKHIIPDGGTLKDASFNQFHIETYEWARDKIAKPLGEDDIKRYAFVAPRKAAKSTLFFTILPLWALAHGHKKFIMAIALDPDEAQNQMSTFRAEIDNNPLIRSDFPDLCAPEKTSRGTDYKNTQTTYVSKGGYFRTRGMNQRLRGAKIKQHRPGWVICDEIEPGESNYSTHEADKALKTVREDIKYLNEDGLLTFCGTVTMGDSIMHQIKKSVTENDYPQWVDIDKVVCHYYPAIIKNDDGTYRSLWEHAGGEWRLSEMLPLYEMQEPTFMKEKMNDPIGVSAHYWSNELFKIGTLDTLTNFILFVDPAVTTTGKSDRTGIAVVGWDRINRKAVVVEAIGVRMEGEALRAEVLRLIEKHDRIQIVLVESNQGGDLWKGVFHNMPCNLVTQHTSQGKEAKFAEALGYYQRGHVLHAERFPELETEMRMFPKYNHDDIADAVVMGLHACFKAKTTGNRRQASAVSYI